jgi:hypothetical protein
MKPQARIIVGVAETTTRTISFDGALIPHAFFARTRTWYVPVAAVAVDDVAALPVSLTTRSVSPAADPASIT